MARLLTAALLLAAALPAFGQPAFNAAAPAPPPPPPPPPPTLPEGDFTLLDSSVGYIDPAAPADQVRLRADLGYDFRTPNRAEFFYARPRPLGPGLPEPERAVDFQDYLLYLEKRLAPAWSVFAEGGVRAINPDFNDNTTGLTDFNVGFKYAFYTDACEIWTFQLRTYLPTGAAGRGLGTHHVTVEPALLGFVRLSEYLGVASEVRYWQPIDGTSFAAPVVRYGLGLRYDLVDGPGWRLAPIAEAVGWTVLGGHETRLLPTGRVATLDSGGTSILNLKLGARLDVGERAGVYVGYGRAVTGERWYRDVVRVEFRWLY